MEIWKDIKNYEWLYQVSDMWRIKSNNRVIIRNNWHKQTIQERIRIQNISKTWYYQVSLLKNWKRKTFKVHRLVYCNFNSIDYKFKWYSTKTLIMHKDDNPLNNRLDNLKIWTQTDNMQDCVKKWRQSRWEKHWQSKLKETQVKRIKFMLEIWWIPQWKIWKIFWVWQDQISRIKTWKRWNFIS